MLRDGRTDVFQLDDSLQVNQVCEVQGTFQHVCMPSKGMLVLCRIDGSGFQVNLSENTQTEVQFDVPGGVGHMTGAGGLVIATSATHTRGFDATGRLLYEFAGLSRSGRQLAVSEGAVIIAVQSYSDIAYWTRSTDGG